MSNTLSSVVKELDDALKNATDEIGLAEIEPLEKELIKFCELIDDNNPEYFKGDVFPPGYLMNLTNRVIQKVFIKIGPLFVSKVRGLIHVNSDVEFLKPMSMNEKYKVKIETTEPVEKKGKMGVYYDVIFKTKIFNEKDELCAVDNHDFFFKL